MKVSPSALCSAAAAAYAAAHLFFLAPSLEDIDSINFALGLREYDVARHQPHPPGYPVYIALGRASLAVIRAVAPGLEQVRAEALALAIWSALAGALALVAAYALFRELEEPGANSEGRHDDRSPPATPMRANAALWATLLLAVAPLFWMTGLRPMSDVPGLAAALVSQAFAVASLRRRRLLIPAALVAGLAVGIRLQTAWLTGPLLLMVMMRHRLAGVGVGMTAGIAGVIAWAIPMVVLSGGVDAYVAALGSQAGEDFAWVDMLWANPTPRRLLAVAYDSFVQPWGAPALAALMCAAIAAGAIVALVRRRRALFLVGVAFVPYLAFHLLFQETVHVRYALPVVPLLAWFAAQAVVEARRAAPLVGAGLVAVSAAVAVPGMVAYGQAPHPAFVALGDMHDAATVQRPAALYAHYALRRPIQAQPPPGVRFVEPPRSSEWAPLVEYWRQGGTDPVWFMADPRRTDLAIIDPQSRRDVRRYTWAANDRAELSGTRPPAVDWYRFQTPGWFAGAGWSLTPELGGIVRLNGTGVDRRPIVAYVRRRPDPMIAVVGARHLGAAEDGAAAFVLSVDGREIDRWMLDPRNGPNALRVIELPAGSLDGAGTYAAMTISAHRADAHGPTPAVAIRQFDIQPVHGLVSAFDEGWHEEEYDNATGTRWRWTSGHSVIRVLPPQGVELRLRGESPLKYFADPPTVRILAGDRVIAERRPAEDFSWTIAIPTEAVIAAEGRIIVTTEPVYLPGVAEGTADPRQLGLRLFEIDVNRVSP